LLSGCGLLSGCVGIFGPLSGSRQVGTVSVTEDVAAVGLADLGGSDPDVLMVATQRLQLDVHVGDAGWGPIGAAYSGVDPPTHIVGAHIALDPTQLDEWELNHLGYSGDSNAALPHYSVGIANNQSSASDPMVHVNVVIAQLGGERVTMLRGKLDDPHHMDFPIQVYRGGNGGGIQAIAVADIDQDGRDELITAEQDHIAVTQLTSNLFADPEHPVSMNNTTDLIDDRGAKALATADVNGDGFIDLVAVAMNEPTLRLYLASDNGGDLIQLGLPSEGQAVAATTCPGLAGFVLLTDGTVIAVPGDPSAVPSTIGAAKHITSTHDTLVLARDGEVEIFDACGSALRTIDTRTTTIGDVALHAGAELLAVLDDTKNQVKLFSLE
jgi:hypothetical protein